MDLLEIDVKNPRAWKGARPMESVIKLTESTRARVTRVLMAPRVTLVRVTVRITVPV